ncbi:hypothetical protein Tco_1432359 [Tanacetum coccineum]
MSMGSLKRASGHGKAEHELSTQSNPILQAGNPVKESESVQDEALQGRLFDSFQDKGKYEHAGLKVTRLQEGNRLQDDEEMIYD